MIYARDFLIPLSWAFMIACAVGPTGAKSAGAKSASLVQRSSVSLDPNGSSSLALPPMPPCEHAQSAAWDHMEGTRGARLSAGSKKNEEAPPPPTVSQPITHPAVAPLTAGTNQPSNPVPAPIWKPGDPVTVRPDLKRDEEPLRR